MSAPPIQIRPADTIVQTRDGPKQGEDRFRVLISSDGGPSSELVQGLTTLDAAAAEAMHCHDRPETAYVLSGGGCLTLVGKDMRADAGDMIFIPTGTRHAWLAGEEGLHILWSFPGNRFDEIAFDWAED